MEIKELKTLSIYFTDILNERKYFELRINDRDFQEYEYVLLREFNPYSNKGYTGREILVKILKVYKDLEKYGLKKGFCIFSFRIIDKIKCY